MAVILLILAIIAGVIGFFLLSQATMGGIIGLGCLLGTPTRVVQAESQAKHLHEALSRPIVQEPVEK